MCFGVQRVGQSANVPPGPAVAGGQQLTPLLGSPDSRIQADRGEGTDAENAFDLRQTEARTDRLVDHHPPPARPEVKPERGDRSTRPVQ